jgi:glycine betaine/proline transport system ATP-binding protein
VTQGESGTPRDDGTRAPMLEVEHLWKVFGPGKPDAAITAAESGASRAEIQERTGQTVAVRDVSFTVGRGETFVVMGLSGSGKSTLVRGIARLNDPSRGSVTLDGEALLACDDARLREIRRTKMAMVFQHFGLFPHRRVIDNVAYGLEVQGIGKGDRRKRAGEVLEVVGLSAWADHYPQQLSGGMQQRVGLGRALALDPEVLFFDEPFSALDPLIRKEMQDELCRLQNEMQRCIVFITHDFAEALRLGDRIAVMKDGAIDQVGTAEEIVAHPATDYVREFTNDIPKENVLTAHAVLRPVGGRTPARCVAADTTIGALIAPLLDTDAPIGVEDADGTLLGEVDRGMVARLLDGEAG